MVPASLLWIDLTAERGTVDLRERLTASCTLHTCKDPHAVGQRISKLQPNIICFDFDHPDDAQRALVQQTKLGHPSIPILIFIGTQSVELVMWALRARVWDCFIKPVSSGEVIRRLNIMLPVLGQHPGQKSRKVLLPQRTTGAISAPLVASSVDGKTTTAVNYLREHFNERIALAKAADMCGMGVFDFSRTFKREQGLTFREFVVYKRIQAAAATLIKTEHTVLEIACAVGFNDPSHFTRLFRRAMGVTPSVYRRQAQQQHVHTGNA